MIDDHSDEEMDIRLLHKTESTNALALKAVEAGAPQGTVFVADSQSEGRGRRQEEGGRRQWFSPAGKNLYLSVVLRPILDLQKCSALTVAVGARLVEFLRRQTGAEIQLKWPNDLMINRQKVAGILTEGVTGAAGLEGVVVGLGLNINSAADDFPEALRPIATSLYEECGHRFDRLSLALQIPPVVVDASQRYAEHGLEAFSEAIERWDYLRGRSVRVIEDGVDALGEARGIGSGGGLMVAFEDGRLEEIISGEVFVQ